MASYPGFVGPSYQSASYIADAEICLNLFCERNESAGAPTPWTLLPTPGFTTLTSVSQAPIRAAFAQGERAFFVAGFAFYELLYDAMTGLWSTTQRGTMTASDGMPATISANGPDAAQLWVTNAGIGYNYDLVGNSLTAQGVGGTTVTMGAFLSGRFLYLDATTGTLYVSALFDGTSWPAINVAQSQAGDPWVSMTVTPDGLIRLYGEKTSECWADTGAAPVPFTQITEASQPQGIAAPYAFGVDNSITWLGQNAQGKGVVYRANGYQSQRISTHAIETALASYTLTDAFAWTYQESGHPFFVLTFPTSAATWVYDELTQLWHQRDYWDVRTATSKAYRPSCMMTAFGFNIVGDSMTGTLSALDATSHTDVDGAKIRRVRQPPRLAFGQKLFTTHSLELVMDKGQGLSTGQGSDPMVMLQSSRNGGKTFAAGRWQSAGAIGNWDKRVVWQQLGQARNRVDRFVTSDPVPYRLVDCEIEVAVGDS